MFAEILKEEIKRNNKTWKDVYTDLNLGQNQLHYWTVNNTKPKLETIQRLATYLGTTSDHLLGVDKKQEEIMELIRGQLSENMMEVTPQEKALLEMFRNASEINKMRIIHDVVEWSK